MRRTAITLAALSLLALAAAVPASAASFERPVRRSASSDGAGVEGITLLRLHGGLSVPSGDFGDGFNSGIAFGADIAHGVGRSLLLSGGVAYHHFDGDGFNGHASIVPLTFNVEGLFPSSGKVHPWIGGGIGLYDVHVDTGTFVIPGFGAVSASASETNFGFNFGAGIGSRTGDRRVWGVGFKFHHIDGGDVFNDIEFATIQGAYGFFL
jgi:opacity protein-like surface antigen